MHPQKSAEHKRKAWRGAAWMLVAIVAVVAVSVLLYRSPWAWTAYYGVFRHPATGIWRSDAVGRFKDGTATFLYWHLAPDGHYTLAHHPVPADEYYEAGQGTWRVVGEGRLLVTNTATGRHDRLRSGMVEIVSVSEDTLVVRAGDNWALPRKSYFSGPTFRFIRVPAVPPMRPLYREGLSYFLSTARQSQGQDEVRDTR